MHILSMRFKSGRSDEEQEAISRSSLPLFRNLAALKQKYYVRNHASGEVGGIYVWETSEALRDYLDGPIVKSVPDRFAVVGPVRIETFEVGGALTNDMTLAVKPMMSVVRFVSNKSESDLQAISSASLPSYRSTAGLAQVYRVKSTETREVGGMYLWENEESMRGNLDGPNVSAIPAVFDVDGEVGIEVLEVRLILNQ